MDPVWNSIAKVKCLSTSLSVCMSHLSWSKEKSRFCRKNSIVQMIASCLVNSERELFCSEAARQTHQPLHISETPIGRECLRPPLYVILCNGLHFIRIHVVCGFLRRLQHVAAIFVVMSPSRGVTTLSSSRPRYADGGVTVLS